MSVSGRTDSPVRPSSAGTDSTLLQALLDSAPLGIAFIDRDLRFVKANQRLAEMNGIPAAEHLGRTIGEIVPALEAEVRNLVDRILSSGESVVGHEFEGHTAADPGVVHCWSESWYPVHGTDELIIGYGVIVEDVTDRKRAEQGEREALEEQRRIADELTVKSGQLEAVIEFMEEATGMWSPDGDLVSVNQATLQLYGFESKEQMLKHLSEYADVVVKTMDGRKLPQDEWPPSRVLRGETFSGWLLEQEIPSINKRFVGSNSGAPVRDATGAIVSGVVTVHDVTELYDARKAAERQERLARWLLEVDSIAHSHLQVDEILSESLMAAAGALDSSSGLVALVEGAEWFIHSTYGFPEEVAGMRFPRTSLPFAEKMIDSAEMLVVDHVAGELGDQGLQGSFANVAAFINVPLVVRGQTLGMVGINFDKPRTFHAAERDFATRLAGTISSAVENAKLYEMERNIAETLQETLVVLPSRLPGIEFSRAYRSSTAEVGRVGGDFVDLFEIKSHLLGIVIGDVSGKGIDAAVITSLVRNTVRAHAVDGLSAEQVCGKTSRVVRRFTEVDAFVTMFFGLLDTRTGLLRYVSAGHPPALVSYGTELIDELAVKNPIIGAFDEVHFEESRTFLRRGERLILYTDGIIEARAPDRGAFFDLDGIRSSVQKHGGEETARLAGLLLGDATAYAGGVLRDDAAVLVVAPTRLKPLDEGHPRLEFDDQT